MDKTKLNLQLFADGGDGAGEGTGGNQAVAAPENKGVKNGNGKADLSAVRYGIQAQEDGNDTVNEGHVADAPKTTEGDEKQRASFDELIRGEYKADFDKRVSDIVQSRLKNAKADSERLASLTPTLEMLAKRYGIADASDIKALNKAIQDDDSYYEAEAIEKGLTVEQLKEIRHMERENAELKRQMDEQKRRQTADETYARWMQQSEETKRMYKNFDLNAEAKNPQFVQLLNSGIDVRTAYEVIHKDEIIPQAMQMTAKAVETKIANSMRSGNRPAENGQGAQATPLVKTSVSQFSKADLKEIERRVLRGERIVL